jgi:peptidoglycan-associated lipoprotein
MMKSSMAALLAIGLMSFACTDDAKKMEEPIVKVDDQAHDFTVDPTSGKLEFKAEIVYFGYDESSLTPEGMARLDSIAKHMKEQDKVKLSIEGHCDDRGSTEYNLALGQRRSESVRKYLSTVGISMDRLNSVSFGEERPALTGNGEENWSKNRRAEFAFKS